MLEALGVRTLGEFAALPAPSVARPFQADYQALARGESDATLRPYSPEAPIREEVTISASKVLELRDLLPAGEQAAGLSVPAAVALIAQRLALRLAGRERAAARLDITAIGGDGTREVPITLAHGAADADTIAHVISGAIESIASEQGTAQGAWRLRVVVAGELVLGGETTEIFAEGSSRYAAAGSIFAAHAGEVPANARAGELSADEPPHRHAEPINPLAVVLSSSGSLFALSAPGLRAERRDAHRRTRRGKQRRTRPTPLAQSRLFDRTSSKS